MDTAAAEKTPPFACSFDVHSLEFPSHGKFVARGYARNTGTQAWDNSVIGNPAPYRVAARIYVATVPKPVWEGRAEFEGFSILPESEVPFEIRAELPAYSGVEFYLELDVIKEGAFWFHEANSQPAARFEFASEHRPVEWAAYFIINRLEVTPDSRLQVSGLIRNIGDREWNNTVDGENRINIGIRAWTKGALRNVLCWEGREQLSELIVGPGEEIPFQAEADFTGLKSGEYLIEFDLVRETEFWFQEMGSIPAYAECVISGVGRNIDIESVKLRHGFLLTIKGTVTNTGTDPWDNSDAASDTPYRVALCINRNGSEERVYETRCDFPVACVETGAKFPFMFNIDTLKLEPGDYQIHVDVVKERCFWFEGVGLPPCIIDHTVAPAGIHEDKAEKCIRRFVKENRFPPRILIIAPTLPLFDQSAGGLRLLRLLKLFKEKGCEVVYLFESTGVTEDASRYVNELKSIGIEASPDPLACLGEMEHDSFEVCILAWHHCARSFIDNVRCVLPNGLIIIDTVDIHWRREQRGTEEGLLSFTPEELTERKRAEQDVYSKADVVWVVTDQDREALLEELPDCCCRIVPLISEAAAGTAASDDTYIVTFVGGFRHPPNQSAAFWGEEICRAFRARTGIQIKYHIVGSCPTPEVLALDNGIDTFVFPDVPDVRPYLRESRVLLAPLKYGAGMKGKILDAVLEGVPVLTTSTGNEGFNFLSEREAFIADSTEEFVAHLTGIFSGTVDLTNIRKAAVDKVMKSTGPEAVWKSIESTFYPKHIVLGIVTCQQTDLLDGCLRAILERTTYPDFRIAVVLNGCGEEQKKIVEAHRTKYPDKIDLFQNAENEFFVLPNNLIIRSYPDSDIVLVNDDLEVSNRAWLTNLFDAAYSSPRIGAAGGKMLTPAGLISEAGAELYKDGSGINLGRGFPGDARPFSVPRFVGFVSGCLLYMKRESIALCGALDEDFCPMYYEDAAWQYKLHVYGLKTIYTPGCVAVHHEGSSAGSSMMKGMKVYQDVNREKFLAKFRGIDIEKFN